MLQTWYALQITKGKKATLKKLRHFICTYVPAPISFDSSYLLCSNCLLLWSSFASLLKERNSLCKNREHNIKSFYISLKWLQYLCTNSHILMHQFPSIFFVLFDCLLSLSSPILIFFLSFRNII